MNDVHVSIRSNMNEVHMSLTPYRQDQRINRFLIADKPDSETAKPLPNRNDRRAAARQMARELNRARKVTER